MQTTRRGFLKGLAGLGAALIVPQTALALPEAAPLLAPAPALVVPERKLWALDRTMVAPRADFAPAFWALDERRALIGRDYRGREYYTPTERQVTFTVPLRAGLPQVGDRVRLDLGGRKLSDALITAITANWGPGQDLAVELRAVAREWMPQG